MMKDDELHEQYFRWMIALVECDRYKFKVFGKNRYKKLLRNLYRTTFVWKHPMDANRAEDGIFLRYRFGYDAGIEDRIIAYALDTCECSMLEMMIALGLKCEENLADESSYDCDVSVWFAKMIENMGLDRFDDDSFDYGYFLYKMDQFMDCRYKQDGTGGLFKLTDFDGDVRNIEIWEQACRFFNEQNGFAHLEGGM